MRSPLTRAPPCAFCGAGAEKEICMALPPLTGAICRDCLEIAWRELRPTATELRELAQEPMELRPVVVHFRPEGPPSLPDARSVILRTLNEIDELIDAGRHREARLLAKIEHHRFPDDPQLRDRLEELDRLLRSG